MEVYDMIELQNMEIEVVTDPKEISVEANELESIIFDLIGEILLAACILQNQCKCIEIVMY